MNVWILIDGERKGPMTDYEVRRRIADGEFTKETVGWHDGCAEWMPLAKMDLFEREFSQPKPVTRVEVPVEVETGPRGEWATGVFWLRRFWARWIDLNLFAGVWWLGLYVVGADVGAVLGNLWMILLLYLPWVPLEAYLIARFQTTPGKWLTGMRIVNPEGRNLDFALSLRRALRVYFLGVGMGWGVISLICQSVSFFTVRSTGLAIWDREGTHVVQAKTWTPDRALGLVAACFLASFMQWAVLAPYRMEVIAKTYPELHEWMEKNNPPYLPKKH